MWGRMKKNVKWTLLALGLGSVVLGSGTAQADYDSATNTDTLTNQMISRTHGDTSKGDYSEYNHSDRDLVINWSEENRDKVVGIYNADVTAKNITINTDFPPFRGNRYISYTGIVSDESSGTHIKASGDITIDTYNDSLRADEEGAITIEGFKNLHITSHANGYAGIGAAIYSNGTVTFTGDEGSTVNITRTNVRGSYEETIHGSGISIEADTIHIDSNWTAVEGKHTALSARDIDIRGRIHGEGKIISRPHGTITMTAGAVTEDGSYDHGSYEAIGDWYGYGITNWSINERNDEDVRVHIQGGIYLDNGSNLTLNMTGDYSIIDTRYPVKVKEGERGYMGCIDAQMSRAQIDISGHDSRVYGGIYVEDRLYDNNPSSVRMQVSGDRFMMTIGEGMVPYVGRNWYRNGKKINLLESGFWTYGGATLAISGKDSYLEGDVEVGSISTIHMNISGDRGTWEGNTAVFPWGHGAFVFSGKDMQVIGDMETAWLWVGEIISPYSRGMPNGMFDPDVIVSSFDIPPDLSYLLDKKTTLVTRFFGNNAQMIGNMRSKISWGSIDATFSGADARLKGDVESFIDVKPTNALSKKYGYDRDGDGVCDIDCFNPKSALTKGALVNLTFSGPRGVHEGNLMAEGYSTLNASYTGEHTLFKGDANNTGIMNLIVANQSSMIGNMMNGEKVYTTQEGTLVERSEGTLTARFDTGSHWEGSLTHTAGTTSLSLSNQSEWTGNATSTGGTVGISLDNGSRWSGNFDTNTNDGENTVTLSASQWVGNLDVQGEDGTTKVIVNDGSEWRGTAVGHGDIAVTGNSLWHLTGDSLANKVALDAGSTIYLEGTAHSLETNYLGGTGGQWVMDLHYGTDDVEDYRNGMTSDFVVAHDGSGNGYSVTMTADSSVNAMRDGNKLYFASSKADTSSFAVNDSIQIQNYRKIYNKNLVVKKETDTTDTVYAGYDNWFLTPDMLKGQDGNTINPNGTVAGAAYNTTFAVWRDDDTLLKRLGDLRQNETDQGLWARFTTKRLERSGSEGFDGIYKTLQVGWDKASESDSGTWYYGGAVSHLWGNTDYTNGHGTQQATDVSIYATQLRHSGHYWDLVARFGRMNSDYTTTYGDHGAFKNWVSSISAEYGRKKALAHGWTVEPQAQLTYNYMWGDNYTTRNRAIASQDNAISLVGRLGVVLSRELGSEGKQPSRVYAKASILHDFLGRTESGIHDDVYFTDTDDLGDTWYVLGIGADVYLNDNTRFYFDAERNFGADVQMKYRFNAGLRVTF